METTTLPSRLIGFHLYVDWNSDGFYDDESQFLVSARGDWRLTPPEDGISSGRGIVSSMALTLLNHNGRYSPLRPDGALHAAIVGGGAYHAPCVLVVTVDEMAARVFTGVLKLPREDTLTATSEPTVTIEARSNEERLLQRRMSTTGTQFAAWHDEGATEAEIIADILAAAGIASGGMALDFGVVSPPWAWLDDDSITEALWQIAGATGGRYYADPDGLHRYDNFTAWQHAPRSKTVQYRFTKDDYHALEAWYDDADLYSEIQIETTPLKPALPDVAWEADAPIRVYAGATEKVTAELKSPLYGAGEITYIARTLGGTNAAAAVAITPTYYAERVELAIANTGAVLVDVARLRISGRLVEADEKQTVKKTAAADGENGTFFSTRGLTRTRRISGRRYIQTTAHAQSLAQFLLDLSERPKLMFRLGGLLGRPDLRLGDRIRIADGDWADGRGDAGGSASLVADAGRAIVAGETILNAPVVIAAGVTVVVTGTWTVLDSAKIGRTIIVNETITDTTDYSGQTIVENGPPTIAAGIAMTIAGTWVVRSFGTDAYVTSISWQLSRGGFLQTVEAVSVADMFPRDGNYFVLGADALGGAKAVFY